MKHVLGIISTFNLIHNNSFLKFKIIIREIQLQGFPSIIIAIIPAKNVSNIAKC